MSNKFLQTSSLLALIGLSLFSFSAKAMDPGEENNHSHALTTNLVWEDRFQRLEEENITLRNTIREMKEKLYPSNPLRAVFNSKVGWTQYTNNTWAPVEFDTFEGNERLRGNLSTIEIPEDGIYLLSAEYYWGARGGPTQTRTAIAINNPANIRNDWHHHNLSQNTDIKNGIKRRTYLKMGDKVMLSIQGAQNANIFLGHFQFEIEKIH